MYDWSACNAPTTVEAVLLHLQGPAGGTITFSVDTVTCPNTNGVGVGGVGGIFNCGLKGETLKIECTGTCTAGLNIVELGVWKSQAMNLFGTAS